jgi:eukaryotic-like serine/threonine-protein kinase
MPIEQLNGQPNYRSDIYAVGMIGIQAITGIEFAPCLGGGLDTDAQGEIIWRSRARVSNGLARILTKMVRYKCCDRFPTAREA